MMLRLILFCLVCLTGASFAQGQASESLQPQRKGIIYNHETAFNIKMSTNRGLIFGVEKGRLRTYYKTKYYHLSIGELKHPREVKQSAPPRTNFRSYVYGKRNNLIALRAGWGAKRYFSEKAKVKGVAVGLSYSFGPTLGLLKPYYVALALSTPENPNQYYLQLEKYKSENADIFLDNYRIFGAASFTKGLSEISIIPGGNASIAFHMDWGAFDEKVKALEIGAMIDVFPYPAPILVPEANNSPLFLNFFVNLQFGKRR